MYFRTTGNCSSPSVFILQYFFFMLSEYISIICINTCYFWILHLIFGQLSLFKLSMKINPLNNGEISTILQQVVITLKGLKGTRMKLFWNQLLDFISAKYMFVQMLFSFASHKKRFLLSFYQRASAVSFGSLFSDWWLTAMHWGVIHFTGRSTICK